jgi:hypothetical protein
VFSTPEANVESRNLRHSLARSDSILLAGTSLTLLETLRNVRGSKVQVISCEKHLLLSLISRPLLGYLLLCSVGFFNPRYKAEGSKVLISFNSAYFYARNRVGNGLLLKKVQK